MKIPKLICTSTIRSVQKGDSHGGIYIVDFENDSFKQVVDWNEVNIDWAGRGGDRGLRGIEFYEGMTIISSSDELFFFDKDFNIVESYRNPYMKHSHELHKQGDKLYVTSTGYDAVLVFDLPSRKFEKGYCVRPASNKRKALDNYRNYLKFMWFKDYELQEFDPDKGDGPHAEDIIHINHVKADGDKFYISGTKFNSLIEVDMAKGAITNLTKIHYGTHNAQWNGGRLLFNDTKEDRALLKSKEGKVLRRYHIQEYDTTQLSNTDIPQDHAKKGFCRGMALFGDYLAVGYSPSTVSVYELEGDGQPIKTMNISLDIRNTIHGLAVYPY
jgi:hypothetical protein